MLEFSLATTLISLLVMVAALVGRYVEMRREASDHKTPKSSKSGS